MKVFTIVPTVFGPPQLENIRRVQVASFRPLEDLLGDILYLGEQWDGDTGIEKWSVNTKIVSGFQMAEVHHKDIIDNGFILVMHHDTVLEDHVVFREWVKKFEEGGYAVSGTSENDGINRNSYVGSQYAHTHLMLVNPRLVGRWWDVDQWTNSGWICKGKKFDLRCSDRTWKISHDANGNILWLTSRWRNPPLGSATETLFDDKLLATHLWYSMADARAMGNLHTIEGYDPVTCGRWRSKFYNEYGRRFGVPLIECCDTLRSVSYYRSGCKKVSDRPAAECVGEDCQ